MYKPLGSRRSNHSTEFFSLLPSNATYADRLNDSDGDSDVWGNPRCRVDLHICLPRKRIEHRSMHLDGLQPRISV